MFEIYKPSGQTGWATWPLLLAGITAAVGMAFLYQLLLGWIPFIFLSVLIAFCLGIGLAMIGGLIVNVGLVRNIMIAAIIGICLTTTSLVSKYWFQYQRDINAKTTMMMVDNNIPETKRLQIRKILTTQITLRKHLEDRAASGWNIDRGGGAGLPVKGILVYLIWLGEAAIVFYFAIITPVNAAREPFSEPTNKWANESQAVMILPISSDEMVAKIKSAQSVGELLEIPIPKSDESNRLAVYTVSSIAGEELEDAYLSVDLLTYAVNAKGEEETNETPLVKHAILPTGERKQLIENAELLQEAMDDYRAALEAEQAEELARAESAEQEDLPSVEEE